MGLYSSQSALVANQFEKSNNYCIEINPSASSNYVVIYFSSNGIFFPDTDEQFTQSIIQNDFFEWKSPKNRIRKAKKRIYLRDLYKQWYINGINTDLNSVDAVISFLKNEIGNDPVITIGSSAGGYAAVLFGILLKAESVFAFNAQYTFDQLLSNEAFRIENPILLNAYQSGYKYRDLRELLTTTTTPIFYFCSGDSQDDLEQYRAIQNYKSVKTIFFANHRHDIPFYRFNITPVINMDYKRLTRLHNSFRSQKISRFRFSYSVIGFTRTILGLIKKAIRNN